MKYEYHLECWHLEKWLRFKSHLGLQYAQGWLDARKEMSPRLHTRLVRSDGKIMEEIPERKEVSIGQVAGWPTAEQYERAAAEALERARVIREKANASDHRCSPDASATTRKTLNMETKLNSTTGEHSGASLCSAMCPDCEADCSCGGRKMKDLGAISTDWYGILHYWKCKCCGTTFVSQHGGELETAAIQ